MDSATQRQIVFYRVITVTTTKVTPWTRRITKSTLDSIERSILRSLLKVRCNFGLIQKINACLSCDLQVRNVKGETLVVS